MEDLHTWSARDPRWARLGRVLSNGQQKLDAHSNGASDAFVRSRPADERQEWLELFAPYSAAQMPAAKDKTIAIVKGQRDPLGRTVRRIHVDTDAFVIYCADHADDPDDPCRSAGRRISRACIGGSAGCRFTRRVNADRLPAGTG